MTAHLAPLIREEALDLWAQGHTSNQIHRALVEAYPTLTRNVVIGVLNRARRHGDPRAVRRDVPESLSGVPAERRARKAPPAAKPKPPVALQPPNPPPLPKPRPVPVSQPRPRTTPPPILTQAGFMGMTRIEGGCQWPIDMDTPRFRFCGAPRATERAPYCPCHVARAFALALDKAEAACRRR